MQFLINFHFSTDRNMRCSTSVRQPCRLMLKGKKQSSYVYVCEKYFFLHFLFFSCVAQSTKRLRIWASHSSPSPIDQLCGNFILTF